MIAAIYFLVFYLVMYFVVLLLWLFNRKTTATYCAQKPSISILIAARNEENNILRCLKALENLNYPAEKVEIIIGDDASTDKTAAIIKKFIADKPNYKYLYIQENLGNARGKANVLAHLTKAASTDYFFITDADIAVPENWIETMLSQLDLETGIVTGVTTVYGFRTFYKMQQLDWLYAIGLLQVVSDLGLPVTTMGNNMLITRKAYESTGGYAKIPFSVTEDIALFKQVLKKGWKFKNIYHPDVLALSEPAADFKAFLHQRKRWMKGTMHLPWYMNFMFVFHAAFYPALILALFSKWWIVAVLVFALKLVMQTIFVHFCAKRLKIAVSGGNYLLMEGYLLLTSVSLLVFYLLPTGVHWKERRY